MAHLVGIITESQKDELIGLKWTDDTYFNPVQDCNDNWIISEEEISGNENTSVSWVNNISPLIDYCPPPNPFPPIE